ncbi:MAG: pyridoxal phosphate-dependent aminotransferase [Oscillospiraceae bacterium]|nr:pyridoxal phosphate-dependent aminotransferase [Oscillospiraceae bacterium]
MLPEKTLGWGTSRSCIRELFEYGCRRKAEIGAENVFDYSLGNPSIPAPACVNEAIAELLTGDSVALHGYTSAVGLASLREAIAKDMNSRYDAGIDANLIYVTCGAAAGLASALKGLLLPGEKVVTFAPFFPEYRVFTEGAGGELVSVPPREADFQIDFDALEKALDEKVKAVIVNSPNNPSGVVFSAETVAKLADTLRAAEEKFGHTIYLIADEPYRELVYDGVEVPCLTRSYDDTVICYSWSKSLSLPGERIGYLAVSPKMADAGNVFASIAGAARSCGYVNAPSLMQRVVEKCMGATADISAYKANRDALYNGLTDAGYTCVKPDGAFYLFIKSPEADANAFAERAKKHELLIVPSDDFGVKGYVRVCYCVSMEQIKKSLPAFKALMGEYNK